MPPPVFCRRVRKGLMEKELSKRLVQKRAKECRKRGGTPWAIRIVIKTKELRIGQFVTD